MDDVQTQRVCILLPDYYDGGPDAGARLPQAGRGRAARPRGRRFRAIDAGVVLEEPTGDDGGDDGGADGGVD